MRQENKTPYWQLLKDPRWQRKRLEVLQRDAFECRVSLNREEELHVHHRWYISGRMPWEYPMVAFLTVCASCHQDIKMGAPVDDSWEYVVDLCERAIAKPFANRTFSSFCRKVGYPPRKMLNTLFKALLAGVIERDVFFGWRRTLNAKLRGARAKTKAETGNNVTAVKA